MFRPVKDYFCATAHHLFHLDAAYVYPAIFQFLTQAHACHILHLRNQLLYLSFGISLEFGFMGLHIRQKFGIKSYQLRVRKGWTQQELAERANIAVRHVQRLESKTPSPVKIDTINKLAKAFNVPAGKLL